MESLGCEKKKKSDGETLSVETPVDEEHIIYSTFLFHVHQSVIYTVACHKIFITL